MGALHEGHLQLMRRAREECDQVIVSLFVNPLQFGKGEDFERYPRNEEADAAMAESVGVDVLFVPSVEEVYPQKVTTTIHVPQVTEHWEGQSRPGHFDGVATVVAKLFNMVRADAAFFGRKDFQQCLVVKRMIEDLNIPIRLHIEPTVREEDGLALSSRNRYLNAGDRALAPTIYKELNIQSEAIRAGKPAAVACAEAGNRLASIGFSVDYFAYIDDKTMESLDQLAENSSLICAAKLGVTRLIDNIQVS